MRVIFNDRLSGLYTAVNLMKTLLLAFILLYTASSMAAVYKCTDAHGGMVYSDRPCSSDAKNKTKEPQAPAPLKSEQSSTTKAADKIKTFSRPGSNSPAQPNSSAARDTSEYKSQKYICDGRIYCSQMTSCEEATFFINNCPNTKMDGNHDGIPCEKQWCR